MIRWIGDVESRILSWRDYRKTISNMNLEEAIISLKDVWYYCPKVKYDVVKSFDINLWPNPWELLSNSVYCDRAQALGIFYTLCMSKHNIHNISISDYTNDITIGYQICVDNYFMKTSVASINTIPGVSKVTYSWTDQHVKNIIGV